MKWAVAGATMVAGVTGWPIAHSLSPILHNAWLRAAGLDAIFIALPCQPGRFAHLVEGLRGGVLRGMNVTAPFKEEALALSDRASATARRIGAANALVFEDSGVVVADNTDAEGFAAALRSQAPAFRADSGPAVILGAGGAARAAAVTLLEMGAPSVRLVNRTPERAVDLARGLSGEARGYGLQAAEFAFDGACLLVSTLPSGAQAGVVAGLPLGRLLPGAVVMDMTYRPLETPLLSRAKAAHLTLVDGLAMLIGQAGPSFELFFGRPTPHLDVRSLAEESLDLAFC